MKFEFDPLSRFRPNHSIIFIFIFLLTGLAMAWGKEEGKDTREGENVSLECRFPPQIAKQNPTYFWLRTNKLKHDNVAVQNTALESNYGIDFRPEQGRYDLMITNTSYDRDNGMFECRVKAAGSGRDLHSQGYNLTVLTPPEPPKVLPGNNPTITEGKKIELICSSAGGSPEPYIKWYKEGSKQPLDAPIRIGNAKDVTMAVLQLTPSRNDDGSVYRCFVWNRAMPDGTKMENSVTLNVNCEYIYFYFAHEWVSSHVTSIWVFYLLKLELKPCMNDLPQIRFVNIFQRSVKFMSKLYFMIEGVKSSSLQLN